MRTNPSFEFLRSQVATAIVEYDHVCIPYRPSIRHGNTPHRRHAAGPCSPPPSATTSTARTPRSTDSRNAPLELMNRRGRALCSHRNHGQPDRRPSPHQTRHRGHRRGRLPHLQFRDGRHVPAVRRVPAPRRDRRTASSSPEQVEAAIQGTVGYRTPTSMLVLENSHNLAGGRITPVERMRELVAVANDHGLSGSPRRRTDPQLGRGPRGPRRGDRRRLRHRHVLSLQGPRRARRLPARRRRRRHHRGPTDPQDLRRRDAPGGRHRGGGARRPRRGAAHARRGQPPGAGPRRPPRRDPRHRSRSRNGGDQHHLFRIRRDAPSSPPPSSPPPSPRTRAFWSTPSATTSSGW